MVVPDGLEPSLRAYETQVRAVRCHRILAKVVGIEPTTRGFGDRRSTIELHRHIGGECQNRTDYLRASDLQSDPLPSGPPTNSIYSCTLWIRTSLT